ncbi:MAG: HTH domain-containing protein [Candidatus Absconditabacterales bacterium]|nr:HTH domain-containing protein [Candidatus Absconditabacterales bacterium]
MLIEIKNNHYISRKEIAEKLNVSRATVARYIKQLKKMNIITRIGSDKSGYWEIK